MPGKMTIAEAVKVSREISANLEERRRAAADREAAEHDALARHCAPSTGSALPDQTPWNYPLFKLMADEHGLTLTDDDLNQIINTVREMDQPNT